MVLDGKILRAKVWGKKECKRENVLINPPTYQEDFVIPGIKPLCASSRRQMRQIPNLRYTECGRPQRLQRVYARVLYFGVRACLTRSEVFAI
jgi:hypothetical protein